MSNLDEVLVEVLDETISFEKSNSQVDSVLHSYQMANTSDSGGHKLKMIAWDRN